MASSRQSGTSATSKHRPRSGAARPKRLGSETPRIWTPPQRKLTEKTSLGFECIRFAEDVLELELLPWQKWFLIHALELTPDGNFRFRKVVLLVGRQNGKSTVMQALTLWRMYVDRCSLVIGTAQDLEVAESLWAEAVEMAEDIPELAAEIAPSGGVVKTNGKKLLKLTTGETYKVKAASRRGGRGLSGELVLLDELREHQSWDAWAAVTKTTNAKERAQIYGVSNAGDAASIVLRFLRKMAHLALGDPDGLGEVQSEEEPDDEAVEEDDDLADGDSLGIFEWSAPPNCSISDRDGWAQANPALGHMIRESTLAGDARTDPEWVFRTEVLCQWSDGTLEGPFPPGSWEKSLDEDSRRAPDSEVRLCVDVAWGRTATHVGLAGWREDGMPHIEVIASRTGTDWAVGWLTDDARPDVIKDALAKGVVIQSGSPAATLSKALEDAGVSVVEWKGAELGKATGALYDRVRAAVGEGEAKVGLRHRPQPALDIAAATAVPKLTDTGAFMWDRKRSPADAAPLVAVTGALWALENTETPERSAYEDHDLIVI